MRHAKAFYFFYFAALAALMPYLMLYYEQVGLNGYQIGLLASLTPMALLVAGPLWGAAADLLRQNRLLLLLAVIGSAAMAALIMRTVSFSGLVPLALVFAFFNMPIIPLIDSLVVEQLGRDRVHYGRQRVFGTLGWGGASLLVGLLTQHHGLAWAFYAYFCFHLFTVGSTIGLPSRGARVPIHLPSGLRSIASEPQWLLFLVVAVIGGMGIFNVHMYLFLYLGQLGFGRDFMGLTQLFSILSELPVMLGSGWLLRRIGARRLLSIALVLLCARLLAYSWTQTGWVILLIQLMHGPTFGFLLIGGVARAHELAPPGLGSTSQGLFAAFFGGVGATIGALAGGVIYGAVGGEMFYRYIGLLVMAALTLLVLGQLRGWGRRGV